MVANSIEVFHLILHIIEVLVVSCLIFGFLDLRRVLRRHIRKLKRVLPALKENLEQQIDDGLKRTNSQKPKGILAS